MSGETQYFGRYNRDVDRITVQFSGQPQREAIMKDGYWYLPYEKAIVAPDDAPIGPSALRGYDADGELVCDSTTVDPDACYVDPDGEEIVHYGTDNDPNVEDCIAMLEWNF